MNKIRLAHIVKLYPWYAGLSSDLVFYIAFSTIWLVDVKGFSAMQVTLLTTISGLAAVLLQVPILYLAKRIGTTWSIRLGALSLLICSVLLTVSSAYIGFVVAQIFFVLAALFNTAGPVLIKNILDRLHRGREYPRIASRASIIYSAATMGSALLIGALFSWCQYLPMVLGIITCAIALVLSLSISDLPVSRRSLAASSHPKTPPSSKLSFPHPVKSFLALLIFYALIYGSIMTLQTDGKLLVQQRLSTQLSVDDVAIVFGIVIFVSRVIRLIGDILYPKVYQHLQDRIIILLPVLVLVSASLILLGYHLAIDFYLQVVIITAGYSILPALRDPVRIYCQNLILQRFRKTYHQDALLYLATARQLGAFLLGGLASLILLQSPLEYVFLTFSILSIPMILYSLKLKHIFQNSKLPKI